MIVSKEQLKELMKYSDSLARKFFFTYRNSFFLPDSKDLDDLKSECYEAITLIVKDEKYGHLPFEQLRKVVGEWIRLRLMKIRVYAGRHNAKVNQSIPEDYDINQLKSNTEVDRMKILREDLEKMLPKELTEIMVQRHAENKGFEEIGQSLGYTKQWTHHLYTKAKIILARKTKKSME